MGIFKNKFYIGESVWFIKTNPEDRWIVCSIKFTIDEIRNGEFGIFYWTTILERGGRGCMGEEDMFRKELAARDECAKRNGVEN